MLKCERKHNETWREAVQRLGGEYGLADEVVRAYDAELESGEPDEAAALLALYEWDLLGVVSDD